MSMIWIVGGEDHFGEVLKTRWKIEGSCKQAACEGLLTVIYLQVTIEAQVGGWPFSTQLSHV